MTGCSNRPRFVGVGRHGVLYPVNDQIVVKVHRLRAGETDGFDEESKNILQLLGGVSGLGRSPPTPYLLPYFYQIPCKAIFMMRAKRDLRDLIHDDDYVPDVERATRWAAQVCGAIAFLERNGVVHGDLRPDNVMVDQNDNARLIDFGYSMMPIGEHHYGMDEPFGRELLPEECVDRETYGFGFAGPRTENFALGSVYYSFLRGYYPYEKENYDEEKLSYLLREKKMPELGDFPEPDKIIERCWEGDRYYKTVAELEQAFRDLKDGTEWYGFKAEDDTWCAEQRKTCEEWVKAGKLDRLFSERQV